MEIIRKGEYNLMYVKHEDIVYFKARDVATMLGYKNTKKAVLDNVCERNVFEWGNFGVTEVTPNKNVQNHTKFITEGGVNELILNSTLPEAKKFKFWLTNEVIPSLQRNRTYSLPTKIDKYAVLQIEDERDLHNNVIRFMKRLRRKYPLLTWDVPDIQPQNTDEKRIECAKHGYLAGMPDIKINIRNAKRIWFFIRKAKGNIINLQTTEIQNFDFKLL